MGIIFHYSNSFLRLFILLKKTTRVSQNYFHISHSLAKFFCLVNKININFHTNSIGISNQIALFCHEYYTMILSHLFWCIWIQTRAVCSGLISMQVWESIATILEPCVWISKSNFLLKKCFDWDRLLEFVGSVACF